MIGAVIFVIFFLLFLVVTVGIPTLPIGDMIQKQILQIPKVDYPVLGIPGWILINAILNGVIYGFIIWLIYSLAAGATGKGKEKEQQTIQQTVNVQVQEKTAKEEIITKAEKDQEVPIDKIEGIGTTFAERLAAEGVSTSKDLLEAGKTRKGREELSEKTGISTHLILEWVNLADLIRIKGISQEYSDLLKGAGVSTVVELAGRNPENLHAKILEVNEDKKLVRRTPSVDMVTEWIEQAKKLKRLVEY